MPSNLPVTKRILNQRHTTPSLRSYANISRKNGHFNDVIIKSKYNTFPANRMTLSCYCPFFEKLFKSKTNESNKSIVEIQQIDEMALYHLIEFIYDGFINISSDNVFDILVGAQYLELDEVTDFCFNFLLSIMPTDICISIYKAAVKYENFDLKQKIYKFISEHFVEVSQTKAFGDLSYFDLFPCLWNLNRELVNEAALCRSIIDWTKLDRESRKEWFQDRLIRFVDIKKLPYEVLQNIVCENVIEESVVCLNVLKARLEELWRNQRIISVGSMHELAKDKMLEIWTPTARRDVNILDLPLPVYGHRSLKLNNFVYLIGGSRKEHNAITNDVWQLDLDQISLKWKQIKSMNEKRCMFGAIVFSNALVVCGGKDGTNTLSSTEVYYPEADQWKMLPSMNSKRSHFELVALGGSLYAIGGHDGKRRLSSVEQLDGLDDLWIWARSVPPLRTPRSTFAAVTLHSVIYVMGGKDVNYQTLKSVEIFDPSSGDWSYSESMNEAKFAHVACVLQNKIFVVGGADKNDRAVLNIGCYDPSDKRWTIVGNAKLNLYYHSLIVLYPLTK